MFQQTVMAHTSAKEKIKRSLHKALAHLEPFDKCAYLDYHGGRNVGDHLIWLGSVFYLTNVLKTKINYASGASSFSEVEMDQQVGKAPIFLHGGGNLGDLWLNIKNFAKKLFLNTKTAQ